MNYNNVLLETRDGVGILTINRPGVRNALDPKTWREIRSIFDNLRQDKTVKVVVITGAGEESFASGADLRVLKERQAVEALDTVATLTLLEIEYFKKPVIAAINGYALGAGCELALGCDIRIACSNARLGQPEVNLGIIPGLGGTQRLARIVGPAKAKEIIFTGAVLKAEEAREIGLVNTVVKPNELLEKTLEMAKNIIFKGPVALEAAKMAINISLNVDMFSGLMFERYAQAS